LIRKRRADLDRCLDASQDAVNHSSTAHRVLGDLAVDLNGLVYGFAELTKAAEEFKPAQRPYMSTFDPSVADSDPRDDLHALRVRLRQVAGDLKGAALAIRELQETYSGLLNQ
jgi:hypothetical protein